MSIKRTIITTVVALALVATVAPAAVQADQLSDLMAQIQALQAQLQALQGGATPVPTGIVACSGVTFTRNLTVGSTGQDVKCLQVLLNTNGYTLAATGAGSPGMETSYFGPATLGAVKAFQVAKGWTPANQVGPLTRVALNALIAGTPTTGLPAGCTSTSGYSPTTGVSCATGATTPGTTTPGAVGFISVATLAASPADNANITATSNVPVYGINVKAINSDMDVNSAKIVLYTTKSSAVEHPATSMTNLYAYDGSTLLGTFPINTSTVIKESSTYYMILSGFHFLVPANTTKALTFSADFVSGLETDRILEIAMYDTTAIGATDGSGVNRTSGLTPTLTSGNPAANQRTHTINYDVVGTSTVVASIAGSTPKASSVNVNHTDGVSDVPMAVFNFKSTTGASQITDLVITAQGSDVGVEQISAVKLYDGSTLLGSITLSSAVSGATATFSDLTIDVAKDATKVLTAKADIESDVLSDGSEYIKLVIANPSTDVTFNKPNLAAAHPTATSAVAGNFMYLYDNVVATWSLVSATSSYTYNATTPSSSYTSGKITLKVHSDGGDTTEPVAADITVTAYVDGVANGAAVSKTITLTPDNTSDLIASGEDTEVVIDVSEPRGVTASSGSYSGTGFVDFRVTNLAWVTTDGTYTSTETAQTWGLDTFKTPAVNAQ